MSIYEICGIAVLVISVLVNVAWAVQIQRAKRIVANALKFRDDYQAAMADRNMSDAERVVLANDAIPIFEDLIAIFQVMANVVMSVVGIVGRRGKISLPK